MKFYYRFAIFLFFFGVPISWLNLGLAQIQPQSVIPPVVQSVTGQGLAIADDNSCWVQYSRSFYEWRCANRYLPQSAQALALSIGVIEGRRSVLVIDSGATTKVGFHAATAVEARFPGRAIYVLNTQSKAPHFLGNYGFLQVLSGYLRQVSAFKGRFVAGKVIADEIAAKCPACIQSVVSLTGQEEIKPNEIVIPGFTLSRDKGNLGLIDSEWVNWRYEILPQITSSQTLFIRNTEENVYWLGDAVQKAVIPDLSGSSTINRLNYLVGLRSALQSGDIFVGSYGLVSSTWLNENISYLTQLQVSVFRGIEAGLSETELLRLLSQSIRAQKLNVNAQDIQRHQRNVIQIINELRRFTR